MHAMGMRRVPAERARHAKRLGHVQPGPGHVFPVFADAAAASDTETIRTLVPSTTPSQASPTPATPTTHPSNSAPTSSSTSTSSALTSPTTSSATSSANTLLSVLSSSTNTPAGPTSIFPTSSTPTPSPQAHVGAAHNNGLSGGAIAGIIAGGAVVGAALIVFFIRKTYLRRRERKRISWTGAPGLSTINEPKTVPDITERRASFTGTANIPRNVPLSPFTAHGQSMYSASTPSLAHMQPPPMPTYAAPTPPPVTYNNPAPVAAYPTQPVPSPYGNSVAMTHGNPSLPPGLSSAHAQRAPMEVAVRCTFVPSLPDELSITTGERIFVLERYDDGWDLCTNARGERGMVPRECLEQVTIDHPDGGWRNAGRASSLNPDGQRY